MILLALLHLRLLGIESFQSLRPLVSRRLSFTSTTTTTTTRRPPCTTFNFPITTTTPFTVFCATIGQEKENENENRNANAFDLVSEELRNTLSIELGVVEPNEVQNSSLPIAFGGDDVFIIAQTGSGKTLSFLLPILHRLNNDNDNENSGAIIIGPTEELVAQHRTIAAKLAPALVHRLLFKTSRQLLSELKNNDTVTDTDTDQKEFIDIKIIAIDEVDAVLCGSEFDDTIPDASAELLRRLPDRSQCQYILTTAHLTRAHTGVITKLFPEIQTIRQNSPDGSMNRVLVPTLRQEFHYFSGKSIDARLSKLQDVLNKKLSKTKNDTEYDNNNDNNSDTQTNSSTLIFCKDEDEVDIVHSFLIQNPSMNQTFVPRKLHALLPLPERTDALSSFRNPNNKNGSCRLLVTHELAARGLDCPSVRHVILFDTPTDVTAFVHRAGRTARAGEEGVVTCLVSAGGFGGGGGSFGRHKVLHELKDAPKLNFVKGS